jgi:HEAT repeat protein
MYACSRRLALYPLGHPTTQETLKKPLNSLNEIFAFKLSFVVELFRDRLVGEGILLDDTIIVSAIALEMKKHKLTNVVFHYDTSIGDLYHFLSVLVSKPGPYEDNVARVLKAKNVHSIVTNIEEPMRLYHFDGGGLPGVQFHIEDRIKEILAEHAEIIGLYYMGRINGDADVARELGIDLRLAFLTRFFRESLMALDREKGIQLIEQTVISTDWLGDSPDALAVAGLKRLFDDFLSQNRDEEVIARIYRLLKKIGTPDGIMNQVLNKSSFLKLKALRESETIVEILRYSEPAQIDPASLKKTVFKLAAAGQRVFLQDLMEQLIRSLSAPTAEQRQQTAALLITAGEVLANGGFFEDFNSLCKEIIRQSLLPTDTIEPVEIASEFLRFALKNSRWQEFKALSRTLRGIGDDKAQAQFKRDLATSKLSEFSSSDTLFKVAAGLSEQGKSDEVNDFFEGISTIGSREIITMLAGKLTHPDINIRSRMIKFLVAMKRDATTVLTEKLAEIVKREKDGEISEENWYFVRNILRILKDARAEEALPQLEIMISWPVTRIKLEVIKTLEGMPAEGAVKLIARLFRDDNLDVRKAAVVAAGLMGENSLVPPLKELFMTDPSCRQAVVATLGRLGNSEARDLLIELFENPELYKKLNIAKKDSDIIRATILKALSLIGDSTAMKKLAEYSNTSFDKSLFKKDLLSNTAKLILGGKAK